VDGDGAAQEDDIAGAGPARRDLHTGGHRADPRGVDEDAVPLAPVDDLGVAGDDRHAHLAGRRAHRGGDAPEVLDRKSLLEDEARRQRHGAGTAHGEVVHRPVNREGSDVAAGEEQRLDDERVGGERQPGAIDVEAGAIVQNFESRVAERLEEEALDQHLRHPAAAAVSQEHPGVFLDRDRALHGGGVGRPVGAHDGLR